MSRSLSFCLSVSLALPGAACLSPMTPLAPTALSPSSEAPFARRVDEALESALRERRIVGAVLLVAQDGRLVYHRAIGLADRERSIPMREDTIFRYASLSKPLVASAALVLAERGALRLDDPVTRFLPEFQPRLPDGTSPTITIRQLLTHTSGLGYCFTEPANGPYHRAGVSDGLDAPGRSFDDNLRRLLSVPLRAVPGTAFHYSLSTDVLGEVVARAGGAPLPELVSRLVTAPLGLTDTGFQVSDSKRLAVAYADGSEGPVLIEEGQVVPLGGPGVAFAPSRIFDPRSYPSAGAGMAGTAADYLRLLEALRTDGRGVLRPEMLRALREDQLGQADRSELLGPGMGFGFVSSVVVDPVLAKTSMNRGTLRWGGAYGHSWFIDREAKLSVILLTNTAFEGMTGKLPRDLEHAIYASGATPR